MNLADVELLDSMIREGMRAMTADDIRKTLRLGSEQAFPGTEVNFDTGVRTQRTHAGLTKREVFAAMALQGLLFHQDEIESPLSPVMEVKAAVALADALLEELAK